MILTIFGLAGTGTSTIGKKIANKLELKFYSTGDLFRKLADEKGMTFEKYEEMVHANSDMDKEFDSKIIELGKLDDNFLIDSRLAWYFIPDSFKIKFICDDDIRFERVAKRDGMSFENAKSKSLFREKNHKERFSKIYGISNYEDDKNFDYIIDTTKLNPDEIVDKIITKIQ